ncbi:PREDICTED: autophagy-related protein 18f isoform X2 [Tarenaya hassleriana]|uniref:autophagy-related protein 18f isoform X2 n=1 Tax=Tarenaya hassleriana TaxID=28532 RepID=UPI00053C828C|nr:PREDICTED: autophagy-related protein 18f isoform X2 [Tarenaya hassleriana]
MRRNGDGSQKQASGVGGGGVVSRSARSSFRALSNCLRVISSGASTVARSAVSAASGAVDRDNDPGHDQVVWAGFDKLDGADGDTQRVLLLGFHSGFQVWDVQVTDNVHVLVSRHDGHVSFMQMSPNPIRSKGSDDKFAESRPLLAVCAESYCGEDENVRNANEPGSGSSFLPTSVHFYSLKSQSCVHILKFRSLIYTVRCSSRIVAVLQAAQIHCFDATTLEREYTILTNPIASGSGVNGYGPLAVGPRWLAYSGNRIAKSSSGHVSPQHLTVKLSAVSNGSSVAEYAKESSRQLASGIVTLGDKGYKKLSRYCSEILPESYNSLQLGVPGWKGNATHNGHLPDADSIGMVIIRDITSKSIISQFRAHKSPILALCFDPSGTLLVTASVQGHNINVFGIMPRRLCKSSSTGNDVMASSVHLYKLQRGFTNAVIQDIGFSNDSNLIMISSSRGTSHLFEINPGIETITQCGNGNLASPITLSAVSRIRNGSNGWMGTVNGAASAAAGRTSSVPGAVASTFCSYADNGSSMMTTRTHLLVFSPSGCMTQYAIRAMVDLDCRTDGFSGDFDSVLESEGKLDVVPMQRWTICQKNSRREPRDHTDLYGGALDSGKVFPGGVGMKNSALEDSKKVTSKGNSTQYRLYISEAELLTHQPRCPPLWAKPKVSFQSVALKGVVALDKENATKGEIDVERIRTCLIEARSKHLVPVFNYIQPVKFRQLRVFASDCDRTTDSLDDRGSEFGSSNSEPQILPTQNNGYVNAHDGHGAEPELWLL